MPTRTLAAHVLGRYEPMSSRRRPAVGKSHTATIGRIDRFDVLHLLGSVSASLEPNRPPFAELP